MGDIFWPVVLIIITFINWRTQKSYQRTIALKDETIAHKDQEIALLKARPYVR